MIRMAVGPLGLTHEQFWRLTPAEYEDLVEGYKMKEREKWDREAWVMAQHYNMHRKKGQPPFSGKDFIDWDEIDKKNQKKRHSKQDRKNTLEYLDEELNW